MKHLTTIAAILAATTAAADGPTPGTYDPVVIAPEKTWTGFYAGGMIGATRYDRVTGEETTYTRECDFGHDHEELKCVGHADSPEIADLDRVNQPWHHPDYQKGQNFDAPVVYDEENVIMWGSRGNTFEYTTATEGDPTPIHGKNAINRLVDVITTELTEETTEASAGVFAGYRYDMGLLVPGVEAWAITGESHDAHAIEAQLGLDLGDVLIYAGAFEEDGEASGSIGADWMVTERTMLRVKAIQMNDSESAFVGAGFRF